MQAKVIFLPFKQFPLILLHHILTLHSTLPLHRLSSFFCHSGMIAVGKSSKGSDLFAVTRRHSTLPLRLLFLMVCYGGMNTVGKGLER